MFKSPLQPKWSTLRKYLRYWTPTCSLTDSRCWKTQTLKLGWTCAFEACDLCILLYISGHFLPSLTYFVVLTEVLCQFRFVFPLWSTGLCVLGSVHVAPVTLLPDFVWSGQIPGSSVMLQEISLLSWGLLASVYVCVCVCLCRGGGLGGGAQTE